ncbi:MAG TPA: hypothetical protein VM307_02735 [Egibacteraceae bacterium]|nr:hypothetical protein [Egibacteraceae bacterium]
MMPLIVFVVLLLIGLWLYREITTANARAERITTPARPARPDPPPYQRVDDTTLQQRVGVLREARPGRPAA